MGHIDGPLAMLTLLLLLVGLVCLFSASYAVAYAYEDGNSTYYIFRQGVFAVAGVVVMLVLSKLNYHKLHYLAIPALVCAILLMATINHIDKDTHIISEYKHWEETHAYLLDGTNYSLLIDTGLGIMNIHDEVMKLTNKPVIAVATHIVRALP